MTIHKPTIFFAYGVLVGLGLAMLHQIIGLWSAVFIVPAALLGVLIDTHTKQTGGWH
jgi:uncharacterized membrane protein